MISSKKYTITARTASQILCFLVLFVPIFIDVPLFMTELQVKPRFFVYNTNISNDKEISTQAAVDSKLEPISNIHALSHRVMFANNDSTQLSANENMHFDNDVQVKSLETRPANETELPLEQRSNSSERRIENGSSFDVGSEIFFFRKVMKQISRKNFNYSIFLNDINGKQNVPQKRNWLVRN